MKASIYILIVALWSCLSHAQEAAHVTIDEGLTVFSEPKVDGYKLGDYQKGDRVIIARKTGIPMTVENDGLQLDGEWYLVDSGGEAYVSPGYVFSCYLENEPKRFTAFEWDDFTFLMESDIRLETPLETQKIEKDNAVISVNFSPQGKTIRFPEGELNNIKLAQKFKNTLTILNRGLPCEEQTFDAYVSNWIPVQKVKEGVFETSNFNGRERFEYFKDFDIQVAKTTAVTGCSELAAVLKDVNSIHQEPFNLMITSVFLKITGTTRDGKQVEKILEFSMPLGC